MSDKVFTIRAYQCPNCGSELSIYDAWANNYEVICGNHSCAFRMITPKPAIYLDRLSFKKKRNKIYEFFRLCLISILGFACIILILGTGLHPTLSILIGSILATFCIYVIEKTEDTIDMWLWKRRSKHDSRNSRNNSS